jgi:hypothetical protein
MLALTLLTACAMWTPVAVVPSWGPVPADPARVGPVEVWWCRDQYTGLGPALDDALRRSGSRALVDVTVDVRHLGPVVTPTGCVVVRGIGVE